MGILIFGGLTRLGSSITSSFLNEGIPTWVVKTTNRNTEEEEQEMYFGRNALYKAIEPKAEWALDQSITTLCFAEHLDDVNDESKMRTLKKLELCLEQEMASIQTIILLSLCATSGQTEGGELIEKMSSNPPIEEGTLLNELEEAFVKRCEAKANKRLKCLILRVPYKRKAGHDFRFLESEEWVDPASFGKSVYKAAQLDLSHGVHTFLLSRHQDQEESGEKRKSGPCKFLRVDLDQ